MADDRLLDLGAFAPGGRRARDVEAPPMSPTPTLAPTSAPMVAETPAVIVPPAPPKRAAFGGDLASGADALGIDTTLAHLAELVTHKNVAVPLCVGLLGAAGSGKSFALARLGQRVRDLAGAAAGMPGPFLDRVHVQSIDAASLDGEPAASLAARLYAGLRQPYPDLAREIAHTARDPHVVLRETNDKLDAARHRLDSERRALDDAGSRRARLTETVLYEAAGSQVDAYARANRAGIENRLHGFGIGGDPIRNYKDLVQLVAGSGGTFGLSLRSLWAFKGQLKLIVIAVLLAAIGVGLGMAIDDQANLLGQLKSGPQAGTAVADWLAAHVGLIGTLKSAAFGLAALAIIANLFRAFAFLKPIFKGARLLDHDLDTRRRDLDGLYAHQTKRVDTLDADVERLTREVTEAERRAGGAGASAAPSAFEAANGSAQPRDFFAVLAGLMSDTTGVAAPKRIVVALDHLDAVAPERGRAILDALHRVAGPGLVTLAAVDPARLDPDGRRRGDLERWIQIPVRLDAGAADRDFGALVAHTLGRSAGAPAAPKPNAGASALDTPVSDDEATLLAALGGIAGPAPRTVKRFVNLYSLARLDDSRKGALALMIALAQSGTDAETQAVAEALASREASSPFEVPQASPRLRAALDAVHALDGRLTIADAKAASRRAAMFSMNG